MKRRRTGPPPKLFSTTSKHRSPDRYVASHLKVCELDTTVSLKYYSTHVAACLLVNPAHSDSVFFDIVILCVRHPVFPGFRASLISCQTAQTAVCRHHRRVIAHPLQHGGREEGVRGRRGGEVRGLSGGERERASEAGSRFPLCQGKRAVCARGVVPFFSDPCRKTRSDVAPRRW